MVMRPCLLLYMVLEVLHHLKKGRKQNEHETRFLFRIPYFDQISLLDAQFKILFNLGFPFNVQQFFFHLMLWAHGVLNQFQCCQEIWILCGCKPNTFFPVQLYTCIIMRTSEKLRVQYITAFYTIVGIHPIFAFSHTIHQLQVYQC